jgi:hypothetical protein
MSFLALAYAERRSHPGYFVSSNLAAKYSGRAVIEGEAFGFDPKAFAAAGLCKMQPSSGEHEQLFTRWTGSGLHRSPENGMYDVEWNGEPLIVVLMTFEPGTTTYYWIVAATKELAERFFTAVCAWCGEIRSEILVFAGGQFYKDEALYEDIKSASLDKIILRDRMKEDIAGDLRDFFGAKAMYAQYGIPWKRGVLFLGPPGNGKTLTVKALLNTLECPCIYVKSFDLPMNTYPQAGINAVFMRARQSTPCVLVLEDLDALIGDHNRSFFLNELDGFASNEGIITLATCNHPERLDPSILERPSRFDRKYHFDVPEEPERAAYIELWNGSLVAELALDDEAKARIAHETEGFSFAYIKELYLSAMMRWASGSHAEPFAEIMLGQLESLREQMATSPIDASAAPDGGGMPWMPPEVAQMFATGNFGYSTGRNRSFITVRGHHRGGS